MSLSLRQALAKNDWKSGNDTSKVGRTPKSLLGMNVETQPRLSYVGLAKQL